MRNPEKTRQRLIEVTAHAMAQYGGAGVRVDRIAAESGINKRMIYHYFGDKEGVCATVLALQILALSPILHETQLTLLRARLASLLPMEGGRVDQLILESGVSNSPARTYRRSAVIVLRALLDVQDETRPSHDASSSWSGLITQLCQLAFVDKTAGPTPEGESLAPKQRFSLRPVLQPVDA